MAFNPSQEVAVARDAANKLGAFACVIVFLREKDGIGMASYGQNQALCAAAWKLGDELFEAAQKHFEGGQ